MDPGNVINPLTGEGLIQNDSVEHSGVKGMSWHKHKFGKWQRQAVYANGQPNPDAKKKEKANAKAEKKAAKVQRKAEKRAAAEAKRKETYKSNPELLYKHRKEFTKEEIDEALKTFEWEQKIRDAGTKRMQSAKSYTDSILGVAGNAIGAYNTVARIYNSFSDKSKRIPYIENVDASKNKKNQQSERERLGKLYNETLTKSRATFRAKREDEDVRSQIDKAEAAKRARREEEEAERNRRNLFKKRR